MFQLYNIRPQHDLISRCGFLTLLAGFANFSLSVSLANFIGLGAAFSDSGANGLERVSRGWYFLEGPLCLASREDHLEQG